MSRLRDYLDKISPKFSEKGNFHAFKSIFEGVESFLYVPRDTAQTGTHIHDSIDSKRIMTVVVVAVLPALLFGIYNVGWQNYNASGTLQEASMWQLFVFGALNVLPKILVSYIVGLAIEFAWAQWKGEEIQEGFLVSGILIPLIIPVGCPLWALAIAVAFAVIFAKEIFGGTGMNIFNVALVTRAFLFFSYPSKMSGDAVWVAQNQILGFGNTLPDGYSTATPLAQISQAGEYQYDFVDTVIGLIPGSIGETSLIAIALGAILLLWTNVASWKTMLSVFLGGGAVAALYFQFNLTPFTWWEHLALGGFAFGAVFMATDPVTSSRTETGKWIFGFLVGAMAITIRVLNHGYPEGMMLAILLGNMFAPLIDHCVVQRNISRRKKRAIHIKREDGKA